ncbi:MAG: hypothetical protein WD534_07235 [Phycisphaeraceae bacterium]
MMTIEQTRIGNIFLAGQPVQFHLQSSDANVDRVAWTVRDCHEQELARGEEACHRHRTLALPSGRVGYFTLQVTTYAQGRTIATARTPFAVLAEHDFTGVTNSPFGVCTHFGQWWHPEIIPLMAMAGVKEARDEQYWQAIEKEENVFRFPEKYDRYVEKLAEADIALHLGLTYGNALYHQGRAPHDASSRRAFARYAIEVLHRYGDKIASVEVWNEWNSPGFSQGPAAARPEVYRALLDETYQQIKAQHPQLPVVGGSATGLWWGGYAWLRRLLELEGTLEQMDAISVHPYKCELEPEYLAESMAKLNQMMEDAGGPVRPIWVTELGWPINVHPQAVADQVYESLDVRTSEPMQAAYLVRSHVLLLAAGVPRIHWYDFMNDGTDSRNGEHNFGLIRHPDDTLGRYTPTPAYVAYAQMTRQLTGARCVRQEPTPEMLRSFVFEREGQTIRVVWSLAPMVLSVQAGESFTMVDLMGRATPVTPTDGRATLPMRQGEPVYLVGAVEAVQAGLTMTVDETCAACIGEAVRLPYHIENALPAAAMVELAIADVRQMVEVAPGASEAGHLTLRARVEPGEQVLPCHVRVMGTVLVEQPVKIMARPQLHFERPPHMVDDADLHLTLRNISRERALSITHLQWTLGAATGEQTVLLTLQPGEQKSLLVPGVKAEPYAPLTLGVKAWNADALVGAYEAPFRNTPIPRMTPSIDGDLAKWVDVPAIDLLRHGRVKMKDHRGPDDLSGQVWLAYDEDYFYLAARIVDDAHHPPLQENDTGDQIEFVIAPVPPWEGAATRWEGEGFYRFAIALRADGPQVYQMKGVSEDEGQHLVRDAACVARREGTQTIYEAAIPRHGRTLFSEISPNVSLSLLVRDTDASGERRGWIEWGSGFAEGKRPALFNHARLCSPVVSESATS